MRLLIEQRVREGLPLADAVVDAGALRFRPMLLTALALAAHSRLRRRGAGSPQTSDRSFQNPRKVSPMFLLEGVKTDAAGESSGRTTARHSPKTTNSTLELPARIAGPFITLPALLLVSLALASAGARAASHPDHDHHHSHSPRAVQRPSTIAPSASAVEGQRKFELPPLPTGVSDLKFSDFFIRPVGARGLELTERLRQLDGTRVHILGYMVRQEAPPPGRLLLTPTPAGIHEHDNGLADDLPASTVFVSVRTSSREPVPHMPGLMLLTGTLNVGNRTEPDGRISVVRLALDPPDSPGQSVSVVPQEKISTSPGKAVERVAPGASRPEGAAP